jgi:hypothetical protein
MSNHITRKQLGLPRVTNASDLLPGIGVGTSAEGRRFRDLVIQICEDQGGLERLSEARIQLVRRFTAACVLAEGLENKIIAGEPININEHALLCSSLVRIANKIGISRTPKNVTPHLHDYIEQQQEEEQHEPA